MRKWLFVFGVISPSNMLAGMEAAGDVPSGVQLAADRVEVRERTEFYDVRGNTAQELTVEMSRKGPSNALGQRAWAFTKWELHSEYVLLPGEDGCRLVDPGVSLDIVTTLPRWQMSGGSRWKLRARWKKLMASIMKHENTHRQHALLAAESTEIALTALPVQLECKTVERAAREIHRREVASARRLSREFDRSSNFGANDGVGLGP